MSVPAEKTPAGSASEPKPFRTYVVFTLVDPLNGEEVGKLVHGQDSSGKRYGAIGALCGAVCEARGDSEVGCVRIPRRMLASLAFA